MRAWKPVRFALFAIALCPATLAAFAQGEGTLEDADAHYQRGAELYNQGDRDGALQEWQASYAIDERLAPDSPGYAWTCFGIGMIHSDRGLLDKALEYYLKCLGVVEHLAPDSDACAAACNGAGMVYQRRGEYSRALEYHARALAIVEKPGHDPLDLAASYNNMGILYADLGDLDSALEYHLRSLGIRERVAPNSMWCVQSYGNIAAVYLKRGDVNRALEYYLKCQEITTRLAPDSLEQAGNHINIGTIYRSRGEVDRALQCFRKGLEIAVRLAPESLAGVVANNAIGSVYAERGESDRALEHYRTALGILERFAPGSLDCARVYHDIASIHHSLGAADRALEQYRKAVAITRSQAPGSGDHGRYCALAAVECAELGRRHEARKLFSEALDALDMAREHSAKQAEEEIRRGFSAQYEEVYRQNIKFVLGYDDAASALVVSERMRAKGLRENLFQRMTALADEDERSVLGQRDELLGRREAMVTRLGQAAAAGDKELEAQLLAERTQLDTDWDALIVDARQRTPRMAAVLFPPTQGVEDLQQLLDPETVTFSYVVAQDGIDLLILTNTGPVERVKLSVTAEEARALLFPSDGTQARDYRWVSTDGAARAITMEARGIPIGARAITMEARDTGQRYLHPEMLDDSCRKLWSALLEPAARHLEGKKRLIVLPDGVLHYVAWSALEDADGKPLISRVAVAMLPSLRTLGLLRQEAELRAAARTRERHVLLALGNPDYPEPPAEGGAPGGSTEALTPLSTRQTIAEAVGRADARIPRLPYTGVEVARIGEILGAPEGVHTGADAAESTVRAEASSVSVLHFACHGYCNDRVPLASGLILSLTGADPNDPTKDGLLTAEDVLGLSLDADVVTLSACDTAVGKESGGEGMVGLTRAFMFAGTPTVVSSLWPVADDSTRELMERFYANMKTGQDKAEAMRRAQLSVIADHPEWANPYFWAPFEVWGWWGR